MISDILEKQNNLSCDNLEPSLDLNLELLPPLVNNVNNIVVLSDDTHNKIYNYLMNELDSNKNKIVNLELQNQELVSKISELEEKLSKINNINLLIKLKENITTKQHELSSLSNDDNETTENKETQENSISVCENTTENDKISKNKNMKKKPSVFGRRF